MAITYTDSENYQNIADAIREMTGSTDSYTPAEMPAAIRSISKVSGVKGNAETEYRTGDVNLTAENLGIDKTYAKLGAVSEGDEKLIIYVG